MKLVLEPEDVWLFRDGRPFNAGEDHVAQSRFPPLPSVMQGVVRALYLLQQGISIDDYLNSSENTVIGPLADGALPSSFQVKGPFVCRRGDTNVELLFPMPADVNVQPQYCRVQPAAEGRFASGSASSLPPDLRPLISEGRSDPAEGYLNASGLAVYLTGGGPSDSDVVAIDKILGHDYRVGIGMDSGTQTTREGMLYSAHFSALNDGRGAAVASADREVSGKATGLAVSVEGVPLNEHGLAWVGGERRCGRYHTVNWPDPEEPDGLREKVASGRFLLYLLTPCVFRSDDGLCTWQPDWGAFGLPAPVGVALPSSIDTGGWDMAAGKSKPGRAAVSAGTVYFFDYRRELEHAEVASLFEQHWFKPLPGPDAQIGMGIALIGGWDYA